MDGYTLLTYDFLFSKKELLECLGITTARAKAGLAEAVLNFQAKSKAFRSWKRNMLRNQSQLASDDDEKDEKVKNEPSPASVAPPFSGSAPNESATRSPDQQLSEESDETHPEPHQAAASVGGGLFEPGEDVLMQLTNGDTDRELTVAAANGTPSPRLEPSHGLAPALRDEERAPKRRRLAPTNLSTTPLTATDILTLRKTGSLNLVDTVKDRSNGGEATHAGLSPEYAYLGDKGRHRKTVLSQFVSSDSPLLDLEGGGFAVLPREYIVPPGQRIVTNRLLKRYLMENSRKEVAPGQGTALDRSSTPSDGSEDILDLDDLPDSWDEETQREIDEEKAEKAAMERELARNIPIERVESILKDEMALMKTKWIETKLPRYQRKAYQLWMAAKRNHKTNKEQIFGAQRDAEHYDRRIKKMYAEIIANTWQTEREIRTQACVMEQTLSDKFYSTWLIELLEKREAPPKPLATSKPKAKRPAPEIPRRPFDDEVLTSSEEEDFIVPDDGDSDEVIMLDDDEVSQGAPGSPMLHHTREPSHAPSDAESCMKLDLSGLESPEQLRDSKETAEYIDLITPTKSAYGEASDSKADQPVSSSDVVGVVPPMDQLGSLEMIGQHPPKHWARQKDRWRLLLCLLWKLPQTRREWILRLMQDKTSEDAWQASVRLYQTMPFAQESDIGREERETVAFDVTKLFLSCTQCRQYTDVRVMVLDKRDNNRIKRAESFFPTFHAFIREWAPRFPKGNQIFRTDAFDDELGVNDSDDSQLSSTESPSKMRKHAAREIVQNKEGVDLREREKRRAEELEARRVKLRAALATSNAISSDKSRLIINETKQDGQSFIYVNDEIGRRIKDHQINGVRFIWNQIVVDAEMRQGCLLAHTMGLGKTMQVITFLVAVLEAANSPDESIRAQIPKDLRKSQTVILCPAGLVDNWLDEILMWSPKGLLGNVIKFEATLKLDVRPAVIEGWERDGGVIVMGHTMFWQLDDNVREILTRAASLVICDEAHAMKSAESKLHIACQEFRTRSRIALTGSPLSNNVQEYYSMIDWVAPNFLGPVQEFREIYAAPIEHGLWKDSSGFQKRKALKLLEVLKMNVAPKVQRATTQVVKHELPAKYEFVIFVEATPLQKRLYDIYLNEMASTLNRGASTRVIGASQHLALICNHPRCFRQKMVEASRATAAPQPRDGGRRGDNGDGAPKTAATFPRSMISAVLKETIGDTANPTLSRKVELLIMILDEARAMKDKVLVFSHSIHTLDYLEELFKQQRRAVCRLDGSTAVGKRQEHIKAFNTGDSEIYLISTKAGGVGLNIYGANRVVIFDFRWNPVSEQQAVGRAYRFGQEKTVYVYQFVTSGAFEEHLQNKNVFKMQLASRVVDKKNPVIVANRINRLLHPILTKPAKDLSPFAGRDRILDKLIEYAQPQGMIREIISTDTFEEEDPTNELTAEERKDAQELHDMERLKISDPVRYRQMRDQRERNEQIRAMAEAGRATTTPLSTHSHMHNPYHVPSSSAPATVVPSNGNSHPVAPAMVVPSNGNPRASATVPSTQPPAQTQPTATVPSSTQAQSTPNFPSSAPMPIAGANTYILKSTNYIFQTPSTPANVQAREAGFRETSGIPNAGQPTPGQPYQGQPYQGQSNQGQPTPGQSYQGQATQGQATPRQTTPRQQTPRSETESTLTGMSLVTSPNGRASIFSQPRSQAKDEFQVELARLIKNQPVFGDDHEEIAGRITEDIAMAQRKEAQGFLPDNARWRLLLGHIRKHPRFLRAILMRNCTPDYLAAAPDDEIETRISVMNSESELNFLRRLQRGTAPPDPSNLNNINRPLSQPSARASEDIQVMRRAAEKRTDRRFRLPAWGYDALSKLGGSNSNSTNS